MKDTTVEPEPKLLSIFKRYLEIDFCNYIMELNSKDFANTSSYYDLRKMTTFLFESDNREINSDLAKYSCDSKIFLDKVQIQINKQENNNDYEIIMTTIVEQKRDDGGSLETLINISLNMDVEGNISLKSITPEEFEIEQLVEAMQSYNIEHRKYNRGYCFRNFVESFYTASSNGNSEEKSYTGEITEKNGRKLIYTVDSNKLEIMQNLAGSTCVFRVDGNMTFSVPCFGKIQYNLCKDDDLDLYIPGINVKKYYDIVTPNMRLNIGSILNDLNNVETDNQMYNFKKQIATNFYKNVKYALGYIKQEIQAKNNKELNNDER